MDNKRNKFTIEYDIADLPMVVHALAIARNTAMMCGHTVAKERLEHLRKIVDGLVPPAARVFDDQVWCEICLAIYDSPEWSVDIARPNWKPEWEKNGYIAVHVGEKTWTSVDMNHAPDSDALECVETLLRELEPMRPAYSLR